MYITLDPAIDQIKAEDYECISKDEYVPLPASPEARTKRVCSAIVPGRIVIVISADKRQLGIVNLEEPSSEAFKGDEAFVDWVNHKIIAVFNILITISISIYGCQTPFMRFAHQFQSQWDPDDLPHGFVSIDLDDASGLAERRWQLADVMPFRKATDIFFSSANQHMLLHRDQEHFEGAPRTLIMRQFGNHLLTKLTLDATTSPKAHRRRFSIS